MKKLLLSCATVALAGSAFAAVSVTDIVGTYESNYDLYFDNTPHATIVEDVTITRISGNDVAISANVIQISGEDVFLEPLPATFDPEEGTLTIYKDDVVSDWDIIFQFANVDRDEVIFWLNDEGVFYFDDEADTDYDIGIDSPSTGWLDYGVYELYLYPIEVGGGEEPGEEPGESTGTTIEITQSNTLVARFDTGSLVWGDYDVFPGTSFFASILSDSTPEVSITCVNGNREDEPGINNIGDGGDGLYALYSANAGNGQLALYRFEVEQGYVITSISAYLNGDANVTWTYNEEDEFLNDGSELKITPNSQFVELTAVAEDGSVKPTTWEDFVIVVAQEGSTAVKGLESVDTNAPVVFYDLQGRKVANPTKGIFIRQQGGKASKVVVK